MPIETALQAAIEPSLSEAQIKRLDPYGAREDVRQGEILFDVGDKQIDFFVVVSGMVEICRYTEAGLDRVVVAGPRPIHRRPLDALRQGGRRPGPRRRGHRGRPHPPRLAPQDRRRGFGAERPDPANLPDPPQSR